MPHDHRLINPGSAKPGSASPGPVFRSRSLASSALLKTPAAAKAFLATVRDVALPPQCLGCRVIVEAPDTLCGSCWTQLRMISPAVCDACGLPFPFKQDAPLCGACAGRHPPFERCRSAVVYDDNSRNLILAFKHADRPEAAKLFAQWMASAAPQLLDDADILIPVPLDRRRLFHRRYNQAALLAQSLERLTNVPALLDGVERIKPSPPLGRRMSRSERRRNVAGAFRARETSRAMIAGKRVLVVDDVFTTGATSWAMARCLKRAGVGAVDILTVMRVARD